MASYGVYLVKKKSDEFGKGRDWLKMECQAERVKNEPGTVAYTYQVST